MKLPKRDMPHYTVVLPISGTTVTYRPYTVREQKIISMSAQSGNPDDIKAAVHQVMDNCSDVESKELIGADFEFLMLKLISASVSPIANTNLTYKCSMKECPTTHPCPVNLEKVQVVGKEIINKYQKKKDYYIVPFDDAAGIMLRLIPAQDSVEDTLIESVVGIYDANETYTEFTEDELLDYIDDLPIASFDKIQEFFDSSPYCYYKAETSCQKCQQRITNELNGVLDFLA